MASLAPSQSDPEIRSSFRKKENKNKHKTTKQNSLYFTVLPARRAGEETVTV